MQRFFEFDLSLTNIQFSKNNAGMYVQRQTQFLEFDLSLTKTQYSTKRQSQSACTKSNSFFELDVSFNQNSVFNNNNNKKTGAHVHKVELSFLSLI